MERRGGHTGVGNVLQSGGPGGDDFQIRVMGPVSRDGKDNVRGTQRVPETYHRESGAAEPIWDVGDAGNRGNSGDSKDTVGGHIHWPQEGDGIPVGVVVTYF